ncbi:MAG: type II secretion system protein [Oryzomonas sp.]|uniref:pilus assembly FimT family protein n=1 Tax=Oryzomonas sp. TaxID=2855186 RepID=UPI0028522E1D|nr:type II secretion system protein [Oryzomonas sp.]MDR3580927.1 type II secretion system protein [Oryzomonas sp.]
MTHAQERLVKDGGKPAGIDGFSLIELLVVIAVISILAALVALDFHSWTTKSNIDSQVKQTAADIENARMSAQMTKPYKYAMVLNPNGYTFISYSSAGDPGTQAGSTSLHYSIQQFSGGTYSPLNNSTLLFSSLGLLSSPASPVVIAITPGQGNSAVNCISIQTFKSNIGQIQGGSCVSQ